MEKEEKVRNHHEQTLCTKLGKWWDNEGYKILYPNNYKFEAKISVGDKPFNFKSGLKPHQIPTLIAYNTRPMHWKISDMDTISTKHFDMSCDQPKYTKAVIAIMWIRPGNKTFYLIDPVTIQGLIDDGHKSIDEKMAMIICDYKGTLK